MALESALRKAEDDGITVRALLVSKSIMSLVIETSTALYAKSVFVNAAIATPISTLSALALDLRDIIDLTLLHVLYGASKDFRANGLRLGLVSTKNEGIIGAMSSISMSDGRHARGQGMDGQLYVQENQSHGGELPYCHILLP
ncbi:hypothetical protein AnigIFM50267_007757 [Aspergillus niger]|nr:hypothetical protein AnigIFM50267_007757 [Aspergillus niger]